MHNVYLVKQTVVNVNQKVIFYTQVDKTFKYIYVQRVQYKKNTRTVTTVNEERVLGNR